MALAFKTIAEAISLNLSSIFYIIYRKVNILQLSSYTGKKRKDINN